jgi:hypothetical protein
MTEIPNPSKAAALGKAAKRDSDHSTSLEESSSLFSLTLPRLPPKSKFPRDKEMCGILSERRGGPSAVFEIAVDDAGAGAGGGTPILESEEMDGFDWTFLVAVGGSHGPRLAFKLVLASRECC